jgi:4'-phosphopantetheinyl transferase
VRLLSDPTALPDFTLLWIFVLWTFKEAYAKALGIGLGFDFSRLEFDFYSDTVKVDGELLLGWEFRMISFTFEQDNSAEQSEYQIAVAKFVGGNCASMVQWSKASAPLLDDWIVLVKAEDVVEQAEALV